MFIEVVRAGGVAGSIRRARVDLDAIADEASAREWRGLVEHAQPLIRSHAAAVTPPRVRDGFVWTVSVDEATCQIDDAPMTGALRDLAQRALREGRRV